MGDMSSTQASFSVLQPQIFHPRLAAFNSTRLVPRLEGCSADLEEELRQSLLEVDWVESERAAVAERLDDVPEGADTFVAWFESLETDGPGQGDPLFQWLATEASLDDMRWFLRQEMAGEAGFDDLVALTQLKMPAVAKLELAANYWDEMGRGHASGMHGPMLHGLAEELRLAEVPGGAVWESLALSNLMIAFATHRQYAYQSVGALGVIELTAPGRCALVNEGLKRLGAQGEARRYYALHATLDRKHSASWNENVVRTLVARDRRIARPIAEGAIMRLRAGQRCFERYRRELRAEVSPLAETG